VGTKYCCWSHEVKAEYQNKLYLKQNNIEKKKTKVKHSTRENEREMGEGSSSAMLSIK